uniref:Uncharacterized protein n=1 Tax=Oryza nivara TaxID=4536 RepID=A0A0E0HXH7_ORYNI
MPKSRGQEKSLVAGAHVSVQKASVQKKVIELAEHACVQQLENVHHVSMKREASSAELVTSQNPPKSSGCNGSQLRHSHSLSNWQKKQLEKLSAEKLKKRGKKQDARVCFFFFAAAAAAGSLPGQSPVRVVHPSTSALRAFLMGCTTHTHASRLLLPLICRRLLRFSPVVALSRQTLGFQIHSQLLLLRHAGNGFMRRILLFDGLTDIDVSTMLFSCPPFQLTMHQYSSRKLHYWYDLWPIQLLFFACDQLM